MLSASLISGALLSAGPARADDDSPTVLSATIYAADGSVSNASVSLDELLSDPSSCPVYTGPDSLNENAPGGRQAQASITGNDGGPEQGSWPIDSTLRCLQSGGAPTPIVAGHVQAVVVTDANGSPEASRDSTLGGAADFSTPSDYSDPSEVPVISAQASATTLIQYDRPPRNSGDLDFDDEVSGSSPIAVSVYEGQAPLNVTITPPASSTVSAGTQLSLSAQVSGAGSALAYTWSFDGAAANTNAVSPTVTLAEAGVYDVELQVTDANGDVGEAQPIQIAVTARAIPTRTTQTAAEPHTTTQPSGTGTGESGPVHAAGHSGTTTKPRTTNEPRPGASHTTTSATQTGSTDTRRLTTSTHTISSSTSPSPAAPNRSTSSPRARRRRSRRPASAPAQPSQPVGTEIRGRLISTPQTRALGAPTLSTRAPTASGEPAALRSSGSVSPLASVAGAAVAVALLGLGVTRELLGPLVDRLGRRRDGGSGSSGV